MGESCSSTSRLTVSATPSSQSSSRAPSLLWRCEATWPFASSNPDARPVASPDCPDARWLFPSPLHEEGGFRPVFGTASPIQCGNNTATVGAPASSPGLAQTDHDSEWRDPLSLGKNWWLPPGHLVPRRRLKGPAIWLPGQWPLPATPRAPHSADARGCLIRPLGAGHDT